LLPFEGVKERIVDMKRTVDTHAWFAIVASLVLVVLTAAALWKSTADMSPMAQARDVVDERHVSSDGPRRGATPAAAGEAGLRVVSS